MEIDCFEEINNTVKEIVEFTEENYDLYHMVLTDTPHQFEEKYKTSDNRSYKEIKCSEEAFAQETFARLESLITSNTRTYRKAKFICIYRIPDNEIIPENIFEH